MSNWIKSSLLMLLLLGGYAQAETTIYYHTDALGSPVAATDEQGNVLWRENYAPYGDRLLEQGGGTEATWYTGKQHDADIGLSYYGARWYDPVHGRFMAMDPVGFQEENIHSFNKYAYANNNPYKYVDPDGRAASPNFWRDPTRQILFEGGGSGGFGGYTGSPGFSFRQLFTGNKSLAESKGVGSNSVMRPGSAGIDRTGKNFTQKTKRELDAENAARNNGTNRCDNCGIEVVPGQRSQSGVTPPKNERQRDHIIPKSKGGDGTSENGQILCRSCNLNKSDK